MKYFTLLVALFSATAQANNPPVIWNGTSPFARVIPANGLSTPALTIDSLSGVLKSTAGLVSGSSTTSDIPEGSNLYYTNTRARLSLTASSPLIYNNVSGAFSIQQANTSQAGFLSAADWNTFNNKLDASRFNYITNADAEIDTSGWNLYNDAGRTVPASVVIQDITYTSTLSGDGGNGATISYIFHATQPSSTPLVLCPTGTSVTVAWYNGPTLANNPTATQLKAAYDATPCAVAIATSVITGTASKLQYETGTSTLADGGDTSPVNGTGGVVTGVTFTRNTINPLEGVADFDLQKDANSREGTGVSTDFIINSLDKGNPLQVSFAYLGPTGIVLGNSSDVRVFLYDITNAAFIPITPKKTITGPNDTAKIFVGQFTASATSVNYRLIFHIATTSATAWDLFLDEVVVNDVLNATAATQVPSVVLQSQAISGAVTDHMAVAWVDGASQWVPATSVYNGDYWSMLGFATNILGSTADIYVHGYMDGFSFGPFSGYNQYVDPSLAGGLTPLPSPFTDTYVIMGKAISATAMNIQVFKGIDLIQTTGIPRKGGILTNTGANDGTGDVAIAGGTTGQFLMANTALTNGLAFTAPVGTAPIVYTAASHAFSCTTATGSVTGCLSSTDFTTFNGKLGTALTSARIFVGNASNVATGVAMTGDVAITNAGVTSITAATVTGKLITGYVSGAGTVAATDTILQAINKLNGNTALKAPLASPTFTGTVTLPAINLINGATNGTNTVLVYKDGHVKSTQTTAPTTTVNANAGTGATCTVANATDTAGAVSIVTGTIGISTGAYCAVNFNKAYGVAPICNLTPASSTLSTSVYATSTTSALTVNFAVAGGISNTYVMNYHCIETQ